MADGPAYAYVTNGTETAGVSAVLVEATPEWSDQIISSVSDSVMVMPEELQPDDGTHSKSGLLREAGGVLHIGTDFPGGGGRCGDVRSDFAEVVAADATSMADAVMVTTTVTISAVAGAASLADAGILFPADPAGVVTVGVAPLAVAGPVTMAVAGVADAGILFLADPAKYITKV